MSEHIWAEENLACYLAGGLEGAERERMERHLAECLECSESLKIGLAIDRRLEELFRPVRPSGDLEDRLVHALRAVPERPATLRFSGKTKFLFGMAAAVLLACVGAGLSAMMEDGRLSLSPVRMAQRQDSESLDRGKESGKRSEMLALDDLIIQESDARVEVTLKTADDMVRELRDGVTPYADLEGKESTTYSHQGKSLATGKGKAEVWYHNNGPAVQVAPESAVNQPPHSSHMGVTDAKAPMTPPPPVPTGGFGYKTTESKPVSGDSAPAGMPAGTKTTLPSLPVLTVVPGPAGKLQGGDSGEKGEKGNKDQIVLSYTNKAPSFFKPAEAALKVQTESEGDGKAGGKQSKPAEAKPGKAEEGYRTPDVQDGGKGKSDPKAEQPKAEPAPTVRKIIIRSGDVEYEVDSFDASVATIIRLIGATKGGFIATINSDKLPNGKVRGSVVVRVPPDQLDNLLLDLRKELGKIGELKGQRIGSQDVTKHYTDLESRLRAARTMEERLLQIIKTGTGEITYLLQAEKELGVWRTKIEEIEGELRYYSNLASLSTLTINLTEKEIRTAAVVTESERVQAGIEVEDVEKAVKEALQAVGDAKGRVTRSELKQHAAGQFNAILHFEVAPEAAGEVRDRLKQLGTMVRLEVDRLQSTGGTGTLPRDGKLKRGDTQFHISIYNLANVAPRETVTLRIAAADVPEAYRALRDAIGKAKGRVIDAQLNEQDRQNVNARLDFDVRRTEEGLLQNALKAAGEVLARHVQRIPESDNVTDAKVLFRVEVIDAGVIPARETVTAKVAATDVAASYNTLRETLAKLKAKVVNAQLNEHDKNNVTATLDFHVPRSEEAAVQAALAKAGDVLTRQVQRAPESVSVTDAKVLFRVELLFVGSIPARETLTMRLAAIDVAKAYNTLREVVNKSQGQVLNAQLNETDRQNVTAVLEFHVPRAEEAAVKAALDQAGEVLSRIVTRAPESVGVTDAKVHFKMDLIQASNLAPRETVTVALEVSDVDQSMSAFNSKVAEAKGRVVKVQVGQERNGRVTARIVYDVPLAAAAGLVESLKRSGQVRVHQVARNPQATEGKLALARIEVTLSNAELLVPSDAGFWSQIRNGISFSLRGLAVSLGYLIIGVLFILPWALVIYAVLWMARRWLRGKDTEATPSPTV